MKRPEDTLLGDVFVEGMHGPALHLRCWYDMTDGLARSVVVCGRPITVTPQGERCTMAEVVTAIAEHHIESHDVAEEGSR